MKTYEFHYYGTNGDDWEGYVDVELTDKEIQKIKKSVREDASESISDDCALERIEKRLLPIIADHELENSDYLQEIFDMYGGPGITHKAAMMAYLRSGLNILIPEEIIEEVDDE